MNVNFRLWRKAILKFKLVKDKMKLYYFISNRIRRIKKILRWLNWAWVDSYAHNFIPTPLPNIWKTILFILYTAIILSFVGVMFYSIFIIPWLTVVLLTIGFFSLFVLAEIINVPLKEEESD